MAVTYCTKDQVVAWFARNNVVIDANTRLKKTDVEAFINRAEDKIDQYINTTFRTEVTIQAADGSGIFCDLQFSRYPGDYLASFRVPKGPIKEIVSLEIFEGGQGYSDKIADVSNANRPNGIWFDPNGSEVFIGKNVTVPRGVKDAVRIKYKIGQSSVPGDIEEACIKMAAAEIMQSEHWAYMLPEGGSSPAYIMLAQDWLSMAYSNLEARRYIRWS